MSENQEFFRATADRIFADHATTPALDSAGRRQFPSALFDALDQNGILTMLVPEAQGGIGASLDEAMTILRAAGDAAAPGPVLETLFGNALLAAGGQPVSDSALSLVFLPDGFPETGAPLVINAPWGGVVEKVLLIAPGPQGAVMACTSPSDWQIAPGEDAAGQPFDRLSAIMPLAHGVVPIDLPFEQLMANAAILRGGQILGAMEWAFRRSVEYAMERQQFGREIGKFQAVQQMLAELADHVLAATVLLEAAAQNPSTLMTGAARSRLADASDCAITVVHQVHGAIGFSVEYALNHRTRRLMAWRDDCGSVPYWRNCLGQLLVQSNRETLWHALTVGQAA